MDMMRRLVTGAAVTLLAFIGAPAAGAGAAAANGAPAPATATAGGTVRVATVPPLAGVHLAVGGYDVTTGAGGFANVRVANLAAVAGNVRLADDVANGAFVGIDTIVRTGSSPGGISVEVGLNVTVGVRLRLVAGASGVTPSSVRRIRLHSSNGRVLAVDPRVTSVVWLLAQRTTLQHGALTPRVITWSVDAVSATPGTTLAVPRAAFDPNRARRWTLALGPRSGPVHIATVPAIAGVHLTVAGVPVTTGPGGRATVTVPDLDGIAHAVHVAGRAAGGATVAVTKVLPGPSPRGSRSITVGLDVTVPVRLSVAAGTSGIAPGTVRLARLHSSEGSTRSVDPTASGAVPLLAVRTSLQHGRLIARTVTWTVDSISAAPGVAVTTARTPFAPSRSRAWVLVLHPVAGSVRIQTVPPTAGVHLSIEGVTVTTGADGAGTLAVANLNGVARRLRLDEAAASGDIVAIRRVGTLGVDRARDRALTVALTVSRPVTLTFADPHGQPVPASRIDSVTIRGDGSQVVLRGAALTAPVDLVSGIPSLVHGKWQVRPVIYSVSDVHLAGSNAVFAGRQRFAPSTAGAWHISLELFTATIRVTDALFGTSTAATVRLTSQNGQSAEIGVPRSGVSLPSTVRGMYTVTVGGAVIGRTNRILVSGDTSADLRILTLGDIAVVIGVVMVLAIALLILGAWIGRRGDGGRRVAPLPESAAAHSRWVRRPGLHHAGAITVLLLMGSSVIASSLVSAPVAHATPSSASPAYVYFYQWYTEASWNRAKEDTPLVGTYSSADPSVLSTQIAQIKAAGIDGILTSWKNSAQLNSNLQMLVSQAASAHMNVGVVYEALDFARQPLPIATVRSDMLYLVDRWGPELRLPDIDEPVIIWTGTNAYTPAEVRSVHDALAGRAVLLAASKSVADYEAIAADVDGEAYYWSSSNPASPSTAAKLAAMGAAVRAHGGIWIAPAAAGFDGRTLGHTRVIARNDGQSLVQSLKDAYASDPTAVGVISWNEWSENTYIEPGRRYGSTELDALTNYLRSVHAGAPSAGQPAPSAGQPGSAGQGSAGQGQSLSGTAPTSSAGPSTAGSSSAATEAAGGTVTRSAAAGNAEGTHRGSHRWQWALGAIVAVLALGALLSRALVRRHALRHRESHVP
jgi:hypothetical protein